MIFPILSHEFLVYSSKSLAFQEAHGFIDKPRQAVFTYYSNFLLDCVDNNILTCDALTEYNALFCNPFMTFHIILESATAKDNFCGVPDPCKGRTIINFSHGVLHFYWNVGVFQVSGDCFIHILKRTWHLVGRLLKGL